MKNFSQIKKSRELQVWSANSVWCRLLHVVTTYLTVTNYTWMLCEGGSRVQLVECGRIPIHVNYTYTFHLRV